MPDILRMHGAQGRNHRQEQLVSIVPAQTSPTALDKVAQGNAFIPLGNRVCRVVFSKNVINGLNG